MIPLKKVVISAPFGNHIHCKWATSTLGTFTLMPRVNWCRLWWRILSTLRYYPKMNAWVNRLGLPNRSIYSLDFKKDYSKSIISIHGFNSMEWQWLGYQCAELKPLAVEANLSCPNVTLEATKNLISGCLSLLRFGVPVIAKLPPVGWRELLDPLVKNGINTFHLCNTLATPAGGLSGTPLKQLSLDAIKTVRKEYNKTLQIIGGGGIYTVQDGNDYIEAGADHIAIASLLLNPFTRWKRLSMLGEKFEQ